MANLEDLQKMAQEGKVSEQLLEDKEFISEMKKIIKEEENLEISDDQVKKIIENFEQSLKDPNLINESMEGVSGGSAKGTAIKAVTTFFGAAVGMSVGSLAGNAAHVVKKGKGFDNVFPDLQELAEISGQRKMICSDTANRIALMNFGAGSGVVAGGLIGKRLGDYICKKFEIK